MPAPVQIFLVAVDDLLRMDPRQDHRVVRPARIQLRRRQDWYSVAGRVLADFLRMIVDNILERAGQSELGDQGRAAARSPVARDGGAFALPLCHEAGGPVAQLLHLGVELAQRLKVAQPALRLECQQLLQRGLDGPAATLELHRANQGSVLDARPLRRDQFQAVTVEELDHRLHRVMAHVLVEDRGNEHAVDDVEEILRLEEEQPVRREHRPHALGHLAQIVGVSEHIEGADHVRRAVLLADAPRKIAGHQ